jgi:hypothetical protein
MTVSYDATTKTNRMTTVLAAINAQTFNAPSGAGSAGKMVIGDGTLSGATGVLVTINLLNPAGTVSGSVLTINTTTPLTANATATGTASKAEIRTNANAVIVTGLTVGTSGTDVIVNSTSITSGQAVTMPSSPTSTITHST